MRVADRLVENIVWSYKTPYAEGEAYAGYLAFYWNRIDGWFADEDERSGFPGGE